MRFAVIWLLVVMILEFWSISQVSHHIGFWATFILLIAGFIFGLKLLRAQGINSMMKSAQQMQAGESPMGTIAEGIVKGFAGILLIIPGFFSDIVALIILVPFVRKTFARYLARNGQFKGFAGNGFGAGGFGMGGFGKPGANDSFSGGNVYEHEGSAKSGELLEGHVIEHDPDEKKK